MIRRVAPSMLSSLAFLALGMVLGKQIPGNTTVSVARVVAPIPGHSQPDWLRRADRVAADRVASLVFAPVDERPAVAAAAAEDLRRLAARVGAHSDGVATVAVIKELAKALDDYAAGQPGALARIRAASAARERLVNGGQLDRE